MAHQQGSPIVTELPNSLTQDLDIANARGIVRLLRQCDAQVFAGWGPYVSLNDRPTFTTLHSLSNALKKLVASGTRVKVIMSGAGTSGRLAWLIARSFNSVCSKHVVFLHFHFDSMLNILNSSLEIAPGYTEQIVFDYLIAGGDVALMKSVEAGNQQLETLFYL